jgi:hypothetical protein
MFTLAFVLETRATPGTGAWATHSRRGETTLKFVTLRWSRLPQTRTMTTLTTTLTMRSSVLKKPKRTYSPPSACRRTSTLMRLPLLRSTSLALTVSHFCPSLFHTTPPSFTVFHSLPFCSHPLSSTVCCSLRLYSTHLLSSILFTCRYEHVNDASRADAQALDAATAEQQQQAAQADKKGADDGAEDDEEKDEDDNVEEFQSMDLDDTKRKSDALPPPALSDTTTVSGSRVRGFGAFETCRGAFDPFAALSLERCG